MAANEGDVDGISDAVETAGLYTDSLQLAADALRTLSTDTGFTCG